MSSMVREIASRQNVVEGLLCWYKQWISPAFRNSCRFSPTCSEYTAQAIVEHGWWRGSALGVKRVLRCHPLGSSGYDPVPHETHCEQLRP